MTGTFDAYTRRARVQPVLLCAAPLAIVAFAIGITEAWLARVGTAAAAFGVAAVLVAAARDRGVMLQARLWESWGGGPPTTTLLLSTSASPSSHLRRHRDHARRLLPTLEPLTDERDRADPAGTRETIERYVAHLRERTRNAATFPIVCDANADYGFRRNTLGLRPIGIATCALATATSCVALAGVLAGALDRGPAFLVIVVTGCAAGTIWWWRLSPAWVLVQADRYANALLDAAEMLDPVDRDTSLDPRSA